MVKFDFLHDAPPHWVDRLRSLHVPAVLRLPLAALVTSLFVVFAWWGMERYWTATALREDAIASERLQDMRTAFRQTNLARKDVERLLILDGRLRSIRLSGSQLGSRLALVANALPEHAWLTAIGHDENGMQIDGRADGLLVVSRALASLMNSSRAMPSLVRAARDDRTSGKLVSFTLRLPDVAP